MARAQANLPDRLPPFVTVAIDNGGGSERSLEYDTMSDRYARFVETEVLAGSRPLLSRRPTLTLDAS